MNASVSFDVANLTFATSGGVKSPRAKRSWNFSGFIQRPGKPIYGHFRNGGRTYANYRFGIPKGRCGTLRKTRSGNSRQEAPHGQVADPGRLRAAVPQEHEPAGHVDDDGLHDVRLIRT